MRGVPPAVLHALMAAAVLCALVPAFIETLQTAPAHVRVSPPSPVPLVPEIVSSRCPGCGVVESIQAVPRAGDVPAGFEFTVRLRDGSIRTSTSTSQGTWLPGDRIILMGGDGQHDAR